MSVRGRAYILLYTFLVLYALAGYCLVPVLARRGNGDRVFLSLAVLNVLVLTPEMILRLGGLPIRARRAVRLSAANQLRDPAPRSEELFWRLPPNQDGANSLGFRGPEWVTPKPTEVYRLMFLGDSVARAYPGIVELLLNADRPGPGRVEMLNLSVEGYSSHQGRILTDRFGAILEPDLVIVSYGMGTTTGRRTATPTRPSTSTRMHPRAAMRCRPPFVT